MDKDMDRDLGDNDVVGGSVEYSSDLSDVPTNELDCETTFF